jgi:predicted enzyme related to lactoylglutathione lyase
MPAFGWPGGSSGYRWAAAFIRERLLALLEGIAMKGNPVAWFEIYVQDMVSAKRFYETVFQVTLQELTVPFPGVELWAFPADRSRYGTGGALVKMDGRPSGGTGTLVYFHCDDCAVEEGRVTTAGGRVQRPKKSIGEYGFVSLVVDTEGNMVGLHSMQ